MNGKGISRRFVLRGGAEIAVLGAAVLGTNGGINLAGHAPEAADSLRFFLDRHMPSYRESYLPNPEVIIPQEVAFSSYERLGLGERFPKTLSEGAFRVLSQKIARLASRYFKPDKNLDGKAQEEEFYRYNESFLQKTLAVSEHLGVDFPAILLMWQTSGENKSSVKAIREDVRNERIRVGTGLAKNLLGESVSPFLIKVLRTANNITDSVKIPYYALPRLEGPVTLGIHDIEFIMIARGLNDIKDSLPEKWDELEIYLSKRAPKFLKDTQRYIELYDDFDALSERITSEVQGPLEIRNYLSKFYSESALRAFLSDGENVDAYQLMRTTVFWAFVSELDSLVSIDGYETRPEIVEALALKKAVDYYLQSQDPTIFFFDQISNPKMISVLREDAQRGNKTALDLLKKAEIFSKASDQIIEFDRRIASDYEEEKLEDDVDFQVLTGVAHSRWLLRDAYRHVQRKKPESLIFNSSDELAYTVFLALSNRESAPSYQLAGIRPLDRATLTFLPPKDMYKTMDEFIHQVYRNFEEKDPSADFRTFARYLYHLLEERIVGRLIGTSPSSLGEDKKLGNFIDQAISFGAYKKIFVLPHCSWMRTPDAIFGYISQMKSQDQT